MVQNTESPLGFALGLILSSLGIYLFIRARWPRRTGDTPHCRNCNYIVIGNESGQCPECGSNLGPHGIVRGERRPRKGVMLLGAMIVFTGLAIVGVRIVDQTRLIDWYHYYPANWVLQDLARKATDVRKGGALAELQRRDSAGKLSKFVVTQWIDQMLKDLAAAPTGTLDDEFRQLDAFHGGGALSTSQKQTWIAQLMRDSTTSVRANNAMDRLLKTGWLSPAEQSAWINQTINAASTSYLATTELDSLVRGGFLSAEQKSALVQLYLNGLSYDETQPARRTVVSREVGRLAGEMLMDDQLNADQEKRFVASLFWATIHVEPQPVLPKSRAMFSLSFVSPGSSAGWMFEFTVWSARVDGRVVPFELPNLNLRQLSHGTIPPQSPGHHKLSLEITVDITRPGPGEHHPDFVRHENRNLIAEFDVAPSGE